MPLASTKKRRQLEPISFDELLGNAGMSGFVSFLEPGAGLPLPNVAPKAPPLTAAKGARNRRRTRVWKAKTAEEGHSLAEQAVYDALWSAASPVNGNENGDRTIRIGYQRLAQMTRLSWVSVKANLRSLEAKLAIEVTASEDSSAQLGKRYLVYTRHAILERRHRAGLEWVRRTRGVALLTDAGLITAGAVYISA